MYHSKKLMSSFFVSSGDSPKVFEPIDAALNTISPFVQFCIEMGGSSTRTASGNTRLARILSRRADHPNAALTQHSTIFGLSIWAIHAQDRRTLSGPS